MSEKKTLRQAWNQFARHFDPEKQKFDVWLQLKDWFKLITHPQVLIWYPFVFAFTAIVVIMFFSDRLVK